jgi:Kef-type K+ transport system membrane component KefB
MLEAFVRVLFLPAFFAYTGMRTQFGLIHSAADWLMCGLIILVATLGQVRRDAASRRADRHRSGATRTRWAF